VGDGQRNHTQQLKDGDSDRVNRQHTQHCQQQQQQYVESTFDRNTQKRLWEETPPYGTKQDGPNEDSRRPTAPRSGDIIGEFKYDGERSNRQRTYEQRSNVGDANREFMQCTHQQQKQPVESLVFDNNGRKRMREGTPPFVKTQDGRNENSLQPTARYRNDIIGGSKYGGDRSNIQRAQEQRSNEGDANRSNAHRTHQHEQRVELFALNSNGVRNEDSRRPNAGYRNDIMGESKYDVERSNRQCTHELRGNEGDAHRSNTQRTHHQQKQPVELLTFDSNARQRMKEEVSPHATAQDGRNEDVLRPTAVYSNDSVGRPKENDQETNHHIDMRVPLWLQRNRKSQDDLFLYLIGKSKKHLSKKRGNSTVGIIGHHTNCTIRLNYNSRAIPADNNDPLPPITITIIANSNSGVARRDLNNARHRLQELLMGYVGNDGSKGRLLHEFASSCPGPHRPKHSTSGAIYSFNPFDEDPRKGGSCWITVLELPYVFERGKKVYHAHYLLRSDVTNRIRKEVKCYFKLVGDNFRVPVELCEPYLLVPGRSWQEVDRAAEIFGEEIRKHMKRCSCMLPR